MGGGRLKGEEVVGAFGKHFFFGVSVHKLRSPPSIRAHTFQPTLLKQETEHRMPADASDVGIRETPDMAGRTAVRV